MKRFLIKVYNKNWTFKENITENELLDTISFSSQKNWWQSDINLSVKKDFNYTWIWISDFIKVSLVDDNFPNWKIVYTWIIEEINRKYTSDENYIIYVARWLSSILTRFSYYDTWYTFSKTDTASNIIKSIINYANTEYNWFDTSWIIDTVWNITVDFDYTSCFDAINKVVEQVENTFWSIWDDGKVYFNNTTTTHRLSMWNEIQNLDLVEDGSEIINKVIVVYNSWTYIDEDTTSITNNWLFEVKYDKTDLDLAWATSFASKILEENQIKNKTQIEVNTNYAFENIKTWDNIKIQNINYPINTTVEKNDYNTTNANIYLDKYDSLWKILANK